MISATAVALLWQKAGRSMQKSSARRASPPLLLRARRRMGNLANACGGHHGHGGDMVAFVFAVLGLVAVGGGSRGGGA